MWPGSMLAAGLAALARPSGYSTVLATVAAGCAATAGSSVTRIAPSIAAVNQATARQPRRTATSKPTTATAGQAVAFMAAASPIASPAPATQGQLPRAARPASARPRHISPSTGRSSPPTASGSATTGEAVTSTVHHTGRDAPAIRAAAPNVATNAIPNQIRGSVSSPPPSARGTPNTISAGRYGS